MERPNILEVNGYLILQYPDGKFYACRDDVPLSKACDTEREAAEEAVRMSPLGLRNGPRN